MSVLKFGAKVLLFGQMVYEKTDIRFILCKKDGKIGT